MIFDGPKCYPRSCVKHTRFRYHETRQLFAYLRELEELLQEEIAGLGSEEDIKHIARLIEQAVENKRLRLFRKAIELFTVQKNLIWMAHNVTGSEEERALRRRGFGSEEHVRMGKKRFHWHRGAWLSFLAEFTGAKKKNGTNS